MYKKLILFILPIIPLVHSHAAQELNDEGIIDKPFDMDFSASDESKYMSAKDSKQIIALKKQIQDLEEKIENDKLSLEKIEEYQKIIRENEEIIVSLRVNCAFKAGQLSEAKSEIKTLKKINEDLSKLKEKDTDDDGVSFGEVIGTIGGIVGIVASIVIISNGCKSNTKTPKIRGTKRSQK